MTSRLSYASSPESDLELNTNVPMLSGPLGPPTRLKSSSDPSIATQDDTAAPPPYTSSYQVCFFIFLEKDIFLGQKDLEERDVEVMTRQMSTHMTMFW